eukprot:g45816.t1
MEPEEMDEVLNKDFTSVFTKEKDMADNGLREGYDDILGHVDIKEEEVLGALKNIKEVVSPRSVRIYHIILKEAKEVIMKMMDEGRAGDFVYMDFTKACDKVPHGGKVQKIKSHEIHKLTSSVIDFISKCVEDCMPKKLIQVFPNQKPWKDQKTYYLLKSTSEAFKLGDPDLYKKSSSINVDGGMFSSFLSGVEDQFLVLPMLTGRLFSLHHITKPSISFLYFDSSLLDIHPITNSKMKELIIDFRKWSGLNIPVHINGAEVVVI